MKREEPAGACHLVRVWDWQTRAFHWLLAAGILLAWWTYEIDALWWHKMCGYVVLALLAFRLWWGFAGTATSRFSNFLKGPATLYRYFRGDMPMPLGHNPAGGWSVLLLISVTAATAILGLFSIDQDDADPGPLSSFLTAEHAELAAHLHSLFFDLLLGLIGLHLVAILAYLICGQNLLAPMFTGRKRVPQSIVAPCSASAAAMAIGSVIGLGIFLLLLLADSQRRG